MADDVAVGGGTDDRRHVDAYAEAEAQEIQVA